MWIQFTFSVNNCCAPILLFFQVTTRYYWARVLEDCDETVKRCDVCQRTSKKFEKPSAQLHPIKVKDTVWHRIGVDLVGPLPETSRGCYFSKWPEAAPLKSKSDEGTVVSDIIISCNELRFVNSKKKKKRKESKGVCLIFATLRFSLCHRSRSAVMFFFFFESSRVLNLAISTKGL